MQCYSAVCDYILYWKLCDYILLWKVCDYILKWKVQLGGIGFTKQCLVADPFQTQSCCKYNASWKSVNLSHLKKITNMRYQACLSHKSGLFTFISQFPPLSEPDLSLQCGCFGLRPGGLSQANPVRDVRVTLAHCNPGQSAQSILRMQIFILELRPARTGPINNASWFETDFVED